MKLTITAKDTFVSQEVTKRIEGKAAKMERYFPEETEMIVRLRTQKNKRRVAEITVLIGSTTLRAEASADSDDVYMSVLEALSKLERQIHRYRTRLEKRLRDDAFKAHAPEYAEESVEDAAQEEEAPQLVRTKQFTVRPMSVEDAMMHLELLGHSFFVFVNMETERTNVIYARKDGGFGLLEPER